MKTDSGNINIGHGVTATDSSIAMQTGTGNIEVEAAVTSGKGDIALTTGTGNIEIGHSVTASEGNVKATAGTGAIEGTGSTTTTGNILVSGDITVGANKDVLLETTKGDIYVGTFIDSGHETISANGSIGATEDNTAGTVTIKTGEGVIDILKSIASTNIDVENGGGNIVIGINESAVETVTATNNISLVTKQGQIEIYGKTSTDFGDITMKAAVSSYDDDNPNSFIIDNNGLVASGRDIKLEGQNGDIHITDKITAERNVNAKINDKGSLYFDNDLSADGAINMKTDSGNINIGHGVTATDSSIAMQTGTGNIEVGAAVTAQKDISLESGSGNINVDKEVKSEFGAISVTTGNGNIHIGDNGENEETVTAAGDVTLATELGKIEVSGKTSSKNGDVTLSAKSDGYKPGADGMNIIINHNGRVEAGNSVHLNGGEGDLHISDRVSSGDDLTANVEGQGSLYFDTDIDVKGTVSLATANGGIDVGHDVTAGKSVQMETGTGDINIGNKVTAADSVLFNTVQGDISIDNTVTAQEGNIQAHAGQGDITIGDNGPTEDTVTANKNISLVTDDGKIYIYGKTSTKEEDIYLSVANKHFAEGEDGRLIIFDHNGIIDSARSVELQGTNGDIHVTDEIKAALNLDVKTTSQGNIYFDRAVDSAGNVSAETDTGNITASRVNAAGNVSLAAKRGDINFASAQAKNDVTIQIGNGNLQADSIISDQSIRTETGKGDTNIALVDASNVSIFMGDNSIGSSLGTVRANATGGVSDVALGGNYISVGTVKAKNGGSALVVFTQGATRGQASDDITINSVSAPGGTIMPQVWSNTGSIYVAEGNFRASKVYALDNMLFANNKVRVGLYGKMNNFDRTIISYFNDTSENRPQDHLSDWFSGSYSDRRWLYVDLSEEGNVRSRYGKLINSNGYRYLDTDNISVADTMQNMLDRWFPMGTGLVYFDRYGLIYYEGLAEDNKGDKFVVEN